MKLSTLFTSQIILICAAAAGMTAQACPVNKLLAPGTPNLQVPGITDPNLLSPYTPGEIAAKIRLTQINVVPMGPVGLKDDKTCYLQSPADREPRRFVIVAGKTYYADGRALWNTDNRASNTMNYIMDSSGNFYIFDESSVPQVRHGSIFAGAPVAGAGNFRIQNGEIVCIDSDSGHYATHPLFGQVLKVLAAFNSHPTQTSSCPQ